ncbi:MAG: phosphopantothenoylcysteine decarboxylase [Candidatus Omnitrophota bacterium]
MNFKNKRILITAGPTWVPIDKVRVISNIASGQTGILLAQELARNGARVSLFLGPVSACCLHESVRLVRFTFFEELRSKIIRELKNRSYDYIIHSAAVSDFKPRKEARGKLSSKGRLRLDLKPLPKIIDCIREYSSRAKIVIFKLEAGVTDLTLLRRAKSARDKNRADIIVANQLNPYRAFIIDKKDNITKVKTKKELITRLLKTLGKIE